MLKKKLIFYGLLSLLMSLLFTIGCAKNNLQETGENTIIPRDPQNAKLSEINYKLGEVKDEESALEAVNLFTSHVISNLDKNIPENQKVGLSSVSDDIKKKFAKIEALARRQKKGLSLMGTADEDLVSPEKLQKTLSAVQPPKKRVDINANQIKSTQKVLREAVPNLASTKSDKMTPLEASMLAYYMMTGDDGSNTKERPPLLATPKKLDEFADKLTSKEEE